MKIVSIQESKSLQIFKLCEIYSCSEISNGESSSGNDSGNVWIGFDCLGADLTEAPIRFLLTPG